MDSKNHSRRPLKLKGFTLLELIIVMAIIGVLASIIIPNTVYQMRDARITQANAKAKQVYQAVQDYCIDMQIKKVPLTAEANKPAAFPFTTPTGANKKIAIQFVGMKSDDYTKTEMVTKLNSENLTNSTDPDVTWGFVYTNVAGSNASVTDVNDNEKRGRRALTGITNYLGNSMGASQVGSFIAVIDIETYTVDYVLYSDEPTALTDVQSFSTKGLYTQIFGHAVSGRSQEEDTNNGTFKYVGQYPI